MPGISQWDAQRSLGPYHDGLRACIMAAWEHWLRSAGEFPGISRSGKRTVFHEYIVAEVRTKFGAVVGVRITEMKNGRFLVSVEGLVLAFKYVDSALLPANYPTKTATAFNEQKTLPLFPKGPRVVIGYQLNALETELKGVFVIFLRGRKVTWAYEISKEQTGGKVIDMFPPEGPKTTRVRPKQQPEAPKKISDAKKTKWPRPEK